MTAEQNKIMCPAHRCKLGSLILGARTEDGSISIFPQPLAVTNEFIEIVAQHPTPPEERFRFTNKCIEGGCKQWTGTACGVAERVSEFLSSVPDIDPYYPCAIRQNCRWFIQDGYNACKICPYVVTEITEEEISDFFNDHHRCPPRV